VTQGSIEKRSTQESREREAEIGGSPTESNALSLEAIQQPRILEMWRGGPETKAASRVKDSSF